MADIKQIKIGSTTYNVKDAVAREGVAGIIADLANYYLKTETYSKDEVDALIAGIKQFTYQVANSLPTASAETMYIIYLIPSPNPQTANAKDEYITVRGGSAGSYTYTWEQIGTTTLDLSDYSTTEQMNAAINSAISTALAAYTTTAQLTTLLAGKQDVISDLATIRSGAAAGATAYQKPSGGIPKTDMSDSVQESLGKADTAIQEHQSLEDYAKKDGYYGMMTVGLSENLLDTKGTGSEQTFIKRTSCGEESIADDGVGQIQKIKGNTLVWNQLINLGSYSYEVIGLTVSWTNGKYTISGTASSGGGTTLTPRITTITGHKYFLHLNGTQNFNSFTWRGVSLASMQSCIFTESAGAKNTSIVINTTDGNEYNASFEFFVVDITLMFGQGKEPSTAAEFEAMFPEPYYPYNAGGMINNSIYSLDTIGFNRYDKTTGKADLVYEPEHGYQITGSYTALSFTGASGAVSTVTPDAEGYFNVTERGELTVTGGGADTCVHLCWSGYRDGEFEEFWKEQRVIDVTHLTSNGTVIFPEGLRKAETGYDEVTATKAIKRIQQTDLGNLTWEYSVLSNDRHCFTTRDILDYVKLPSSGDILGNIVCSLYVNVAGSKTWGHGEISLKLYGALSVVNNSYSDAASFKTAMSGVKLYYELATPVEYDLDQELNLTYKVADFGSEEMNPIIDANGNPASAPFSGVIKYNDDFTRTIVNLPQHYVRRADLKQGTGSNTENPMSQKAVTDELETKAGKVGTFDDLVAGSAKALQGSDVKNNPSQFRTAGGSDDIASGVATIQGIEGQAFAWNQIIPAAQKSGERTISETTTFYTAEFYNNLNIPVVKGHKYYIAAIINRSMSTNDFVTIQVVSATNDLIGISKPNGSPNGFASYIYSYNGDSTSLKVIRANNYSGKKGFDSGDTISYDNLIVIDMSLIYGLGNEPATAAEFEADYFKWFGKPLTYEAYNAGSLKNTLLTGIKTVGFNQYNPETGTAKVIGGMEYQINGTYTSIELEGETITPDANGIFTAGTTGILTVTGGNATTTCIHLVWSGIKNGQYEAYWMQNKPFDVTKVYGKLNGEGEYVQAYPSGMRKARAVYDSINLKDDNATVNIGSVDLGTLTWTKTSGNYFYAYITDAKARDNIDAITWKYCRRPGSIYVTAPAGYTNGIYSLKMAGEVIGGVVIADSSYSASTAAQFKTAMSGVTLFYELATPLTYTDCVYRDNGVDIPLQLLNYQVDDFGTEEQTVGEGGLPAVLNILYGVNAVDALRRMPQNYISVESMDAFLAQLGSAMNGTWAKTWDSTNGKYTFAFTPNEEPEQEP